MVNKHAIVLHSVVPVRCQPDEGAEQLTQLLFAETCDILDQQPRWIRIKSHLDGQQGWVDFKMLTPLNNDEWKQVSKLDKTAIVKYPMTYALSLSNSQTIPLTAGTHLPAYHDGQFSILGADFRINPEMVAATPMEMTSDNVLQTARFFLNIPYLWAGKNALGLDCSGFTQVFHALFGHALLRNAREQITQGTEVASLAEAQAGDLVFFDHNDTLFDEHMDANNSRGDTRITHVGMLLDSERVMHCSGRVKVEHIDNRGILSVEQVPGQSIYTHHLVSIRHY